MKTKCEFHVDTFSYNAENKERSGSKLYRGNTTLFDKDDNIICL